MSLQVRGGGREREERERGGEEGEVGGDLPFFFCLRFKKFGSSEVSGPT